MFERLLPNAVPGYTVSDEPISGRDGTKGYWLKEGCFQGYTLVDAEEVECYQYQQNETAEKMGFKSDIVSDEGTHKICSLNILGYIPGVSTVSGAYRTIVGVAYLVSLVATMAFNRSVHEQDLEGTKIAVANIARGLLEMVPVAGNLVTLNIDTGRMLRRWSDFSRTSYANPAFIPLFPIVDAIGAIPIVGTPVNLLRAGFFAVHAVVHLPPALLSDSKHFQAVALGLKQTGIGLLESIPLIGTMSALARYIA